MAGRLGKQNESVKPAGRLNRNSQISAGRLNNQPDKPVGRLTNTEEIVNFRDPLGTKAMLFNTVKDRKPSDLKSADLTIDKNDNDFKVDTGTANSTQETGGKGLFKSLGEATKNLVIDPIAKTKFFREAGEGLNAMERGEVGGTTFGRFGEELLKRGSLFKKKRTEELKKPITKKERTFVDVVKEIPDDPYKVIPFLASAREVPELIEVYNAAKNLDENKGETQQEKRDLLLLQRYVDEAQQDSTFGGKVADILVNLPAFGGELLATGPIAATGREGAKKAIRETLEKVGKEKVERKFSQKVAENVAGETLRTPVAGITRITENTIQRMIPTLGIDQESSDIFVAEEGDSITEAIPKAFTDQWVELISERAGGALPDITKPVRDKIFKLGIFSSLKKANPNITPTKFREVVKEFGWNGVIQEVLEERFGEVLRGLATQVGLSDDGFVIPSGEQLLAEIVAFSIPGASIGLINQAVEVTSREPGKRGREEKFQLDPKMQEELVDKFNNTEKVSDRIEILRQNTKDPRILDSINEEVSKISSIRREEGDNSARLYANTVLESIRDTIVERVPTQGRLGKFQRSTGREMFLRTEEAQEQIKQIPFLNEIDIQVVDRIITSEGQNALGSYINGLIKFVENPAETTIPHEASHAFFDMGLSQKERDTILTEVKDLFPVQIMDDFTAEERLADIASEYFVADEVGKQEILNRFKTDNTGKSTIRKVLDKIVRLLKDLAGNVDSVESFLKTFASQRASTIVKQNKQAINQVRAEMYSSPDPFTLKYFKHRDLKNKKTASYEFLNNLIKNVNPKKGERLILENTLNRPEFKDNPRIDLDTFVNEIKQELLIVQPLKTNTYSDYGLSNIGQTIDLADTETVILNTDFQHGVKGHFSNAFDITTTKEDLEIRSIEAGTYEVQGETRRVPKTQWAVIRKDAQNEDGLFGVFQSSNEAEKYVANFTQRKAEKAGMLAHYRAFKKDDVYNVVEIQSDVFQKDLTPLLRSNEMLLASQNRDAEQNIKEAEQALEILRNKTDAPQEVIDQQIQREEDTIDRNKNITQQNEERIGDQEGYFFRREGLKKADEIQRIINLTKAKLTDLDNPNANTVRYGMDIRDSILRDSNTKFILDRQALSELRSDVISDDINVIQSMKRYAPRFIKLLEDSKKEFINEPKDLTQAQLQEIEKSKKFIDLRNIWHELTIKNAIRQAALEGQDTVRFASDYTVANVEGYIDTQGEDFTAGQYTAEEINNLGVGGILEIMGRTSTILEIEGDEYTIAFDDNLKDYDNIEFKPAEEFNEDELGTWGEDYVDYVDDDGQRFIGVSKTGSMQTETQSYRTFVETDSDAFTLEDIPSEEHRNIAKKYSEKGEFVKFLKKIRPDLRIVKDEEGFTWWQTEIKPEDGRPIPMFQRKEDGGDVPTFVDKDGNVISSMKKVNPIEFPELLKLANELGSDVGLKSFKSALGMFYSGSKDIRLHPVIFEDASLREQVLAHEIGHLIDYLPNNTLKRGNLMGRLNVLNRHQKQFYAEAGRTRSDKELREQLIKLDRIWSPFNEDRAKPSYLKYRNSSKELYAQFISALFVDPALVQDTAPTAYNLFYKTLDKKPEVSKAYFELQNLLRNKKDVLATRQKGVKKMFADAEYTAYQKELLRQRQEKENKRSLWSKIMTDLVDITRPVREKVKIVEKETGQKYDDGANPVYSLEEDRYVAGKVKEEINSKFNSIYKELQEKGLSWEDLGEVLFYERILFGDRGKVANPQGLMPEYISEIYEDLGTIKENWGEYDGDSMIERLGDENFAFLKEKSKQFRKNLKSIFKEGYEAGLYNEELNELFEKNDFYVPFRPAKYSDSKQSFRVKQQKGTLSDIENPANTSIQKAVSIITEIQKNNSKRKVVEFMQKNFSDEIKEAEYKFDGKARFPRKPKEKDLDLISYTDNGSVKGFYVDKYIAQSIERTTVGQNNILLRALSTMNSYWFRPVFITFNLGFQSFNFLRDYVRAIKAYPSRSLIKSFLIVSRGYAKAVKPSIARGFNLDNETIQEMEKSQILSLTFNDVIRGEELEQRQFDRILYEIGIKDKKPSRMRKLPILKQINQIMDFIENMGNTIETLPKVAGFYEIREKMPPNEMKSYIRRKIGSPDFLAGGAIKPWTNELFLFSNAIFQGIRADVEVATDPSTRAGWWWKTAQLNLVPKMLMFAGLAGLFGDDVEDMYEGVSEYDMTNYTIVPLGIDQNGKTVYVRIPQDETGRYIGGIFWKAMGMAESGDVKQAVSEIPDFLGYTAGQLPSISPTLSSINAFTTFITGNNPYDFFRNRNVLTDQEVEAGGWIATKKYLSWQFQQVGGSTFFNLYNKEYVPEDKTKLQQSYNLPIVGSVINRFVKTSDYGKIEKQREELEKIRQERARELFKQKDLVFDYADRARGIEDRATLRDIERELIEETIGHYPPRTKEEKQLADTTERRFEVMRKKTQNPADVDLIMSARSNNEKIELLKYQKEEMSDDEFNDYLKFLLKEDVISTNVYGKTKRLSKD